MSWTSAIGILLVTIAIDASVWMIAYYRASHGASLRVLEANIAVIIVNVCLIIVGYSLIVIQTIR